MIARSHFRRSLGLREPLLAPSSEESIAGSYHATPDTWGKVTSRRATPEQREHLELLAFQLRCSVTTVKALIDRGLL